MEKIIQKTHFKNIDEYIASFPKDVQGILRKMRATIKKAAPDAEEIISYNMPAFKFHGILVYFAVHKNHIGFYPFPSAVKAFKKELSSYEGAKGSGPFPFDKPLPFGLIGSMVKFRVKENEEKHSK